ncbi:MAG: DUF4124 domain-containing protein [Gammaproteobacteria bacterium]
MVSLLVLLLLLSFTAHAAIYKWIDDEGVTHFSDQPQAVGAQQITVLSLQSYQSSQPLLEPPFTQIESADEISSAYQSIMITAPADQATLRNNYGTVNVSVSLEPALVANDRLQLLLDAVIIEQPQHTMSFYLEGIDPGTHELSVQVIDSADQVIAESEAVTFYLHRFFIKN